MLVHLWKLVTFVESPRFPALRIAYLEQLGFPSSHLTRLILRKIVSHFIRDLDMLTTRLCATYLQVKHPVLTLGLRLPFRVGIATIDMSDSVHESRTY